MTFLDCVLHCADNAEFVANFNRLTGRNFGKSLRRSNIERLIDDATDHNPEYDGDVLAFIDAVRDLVWDRLPQSEKNES